MNTKYLFIPCLIILLFLGNELQAVDDSKPHPLINGETRISLFLVGNLVSIYDDLDVKSKLKTDSSIYNIFFTYYILIKFFNEEDNPVIKNSLGEAFSKVKNSKSFLKMIERPDRFFSDKDEFTPDVIRFRMKDGSLKDLKIASREEFEEINDGFKKFIVGLSVPIHK